ncbi:alpha-E domain-containing protein [Aquihabitans sp. G128]|uniref:alpha-E domain-containing protein n=2 Tax=Aquihabitans sp. G128 TaxID=2849779 RepID=UPI001C24530A|nr:alpha-E domain-containing protein [Aquihabitans sp. G128]QXC61256.1 alpha-E domain-containing protein [Aquihabitans sp. G128]
MLSRIAEALYWMGRYLERADDTARLLDVHVHRMVVQLNDDRVGASLLESMGIEGEHLARLEAEGPIDLWKATELLAYDADNPSSVVGSLRLARENARGLREILATEVWEALNRTYHELDNHVRAARTLGPHLLFQWVRDRVALVGGLIDTVLLHDDGWRFLTIGRSLERVDMTARLLGAVPANADASRWSGVLVSCGANDAFLRTYGGDIDQAKALSVLLLDPDFPRSVSYALAQAEQALDDVDGGQRPNGGRRRPLVRTSAAAREVGRIRSELAYTDPALLAADLPAVVARLQAATAYASELVTQRYFQRVAFIEWTPDKSA